MKLTIKPLKQKDAGRGLAAIDRAAMDELDLENGDYIVIDSGDSRAVARVWPGYPEDEGQGVVRASTVGFDRRPTSASTTTSRSSPPTSARPSR